MAGDQFLWTGDGDADSWSDPDNWNDTTAGTSPATTAPGATDDATFSSDAVLTSGGDVYNLYLNASLTLNSATLDASGGVRINSGGALTTNGGSDLTVASNLLLDGGSMTETGGGVDISGFVQVANGSSISVEGATFKVLGDNSISVGETGKGSMDVSAGGYVYSSNFIQIGSIPGADGTVTVAGSGSELDTNSVLTVGGSGYGILTLTDSATAVSSGELEVGWSVSGYSTGGTGVLQIYSGSTVTSQGGVDIGDTASDASGTVTVSGTGSALHITGYLVVGGEGTGALTVEDGGTLSVSSSLTVGNDNDGSGTMTLDGASLQITDAGTIIGDGGTGSLFLTNGASLTDSVSSGVGVTIGDSSTGTVTVSGTGSSLTTSGLYLGSDGGTGTLNIEAGGKVAVSSAATVASGSYVNIYGGTLQTDSLTVDGTVFGYGEVSGDLTVNGIISASGGVVAPGGKLDLTGDLSGSGTLQIDSNSTLELDGSSLANNLDIDFLDLRTGQDLELTSATAQEAPTISDFVDTGNVVDLTFLNDANNKASVSLNDTTDVLTVTAEGGTVTLQLDQSSVHATYVAQQDGTGGTEVVVACFCDGTLIGCAQGDVPIEDLNIGDLVRTREGTLEPIRWIGRRRYSTAYVAANHWVRPILIKAGALCDGLPRRDLRVSPEHAMYLDGMLIPARALMNGVSILEDTSVQSASYFHLEFDRHQVILAEGAPSESFVDDESRLYFENAAEYWLHHPDARPTPGRFCAPRLEDGMELERIRNRLIERSTGAAALSVSPISGAATATQSPPAQ